MSERPWISGFGDDQPVLGEQVFVDRAARLIGRVELGRGSSVWPGAVLRADDDRIVIGPGSAVLDQALIEAPAGHPVVVAADVLVSHQACLHGARVAAGALIGIGAIVLDGAAIGEGALVGAGALVVPGTEVPAGALVLGQPARVVRELDEQERARTPAQLAEVAAKARQYLALEAGR